MDLDGRMTTLGALYVAADGFSWELRVRSADLNRDAATSKPNHIFSPVATEISSVDVLHAREILGGRLTAGAGFKTRAVSSQSSQDDEWRLSAEWVRDI